MIILRNFSESENKKDKEDEEKRRKKEKLKGAGLIAAGSIGTAGGIKASEKLNDIFLDKAIEHSSKNDTQDKKLVDKLIKRSKKQGTKIIKDKNFENSIYLGTNGGRLVDKLDKKFKYNSLKEELGKFVGLGKKSSKEIGKDTIVMGLGDGNPAILAHEMGHAAMLRKKRSKDIIGKAAHSKISDIISIPSNIVFNPNKKYRRVGEAGFLGAGIIHGIKSAKREEEGDKKKARKERRKGIIRSSILVSPMLIREAAASRKGMKYLKESGASKDTLRQSRKILGNAFGTYASIALKPIALEAGGTAVGYGAHKLISKFKNKKKENNNKDKKGENK